MDLSFDDEKNSNDPKILTELKTRTVEKLDLNEPDNFTSTCEENNGEVIN